MKKEAFIAIFLGVIAGVAVAVVMLGKARESQMLASKSISTSIQTSPTVSVQNKIQPLEVDEPEDDAIVTKNSLTLKGKAAKESLLIVQSPMKQQTLKLGQDSFTIENFPLSIGENTIRLSMYPKDPSIPPQETDLKIYYLDEK